MPELYTSNDTIRDFEDNIPVGYPVAGAEYTPDDDHVVYNRHYSPPVRLELAMYEVGSIPHSGDNRASYDFKIGEADYERLTCRFQRDDVQAFYSVDWMLRAIIGGDSGARRMQEARMERKHVFKYTAGQLGLFILQGIEKKEGWRDA